MIEVDESAAVGFTQELVRVRSTSDAGEHAAAEQVAAKMREFGWEPTVTEVAPGRPNVVAVVDGGGGPGRTLLLEGHTDVVTEGDADRWTVDPYGGEIRDGRLYGRGAADMKSGVAAMLYGARALQLAGPFPGRLVLAVLADEEGLMLGAHHFVEDGGTDGVDAAIVCEPEGGEICPAAKGALRIRVDFTGRMAHGAMPAHGRNPVHAAALLTVAIRSYERALQQTVGSHPTLGDVYLTPTVLDAGEPSQLNVIPATASVSWDVRTVPGVEHQMIIDKFAELAAASADGDEVKPDVYVLVDRPPVDVPRTEPVVVALAAAHAAVTGEPPVYGGVPGTTDGTVLTVWGGIPSVVYGPGGKWIPHSVDEYVEVAEIGRYARVYAEAARRYLILGATPTPEPAGEDEAAGEDE